MAFGLGCSLEPCNEHFVLADYSMTTEKVDSSVANHYKGIMNLHLGRKYYECVLLISLSICTYNKTNYNLMNREPRDLKRTVRMAHARW